MVFYINIYHIDKERNSTTTIDRVSSSSNKTVKEGRGC